MTPSHCIVIGGGLAGASAAASLARRGWQVTVIDRAPEPATGASGLPAGLFAPHVSPDDAPLSRLTRAGLRATRQWAQALLTEDVDWSPSGVLEHCVEKKRRLPSGLDAAWSAPASADQRAAAGVPLDAPALWHASGGWLRPARLVAALLAQPGVLWRGGVQVAQVDRAADGLWRVADLTAPLVVIATGAGSIDLCPNLSLRPLRGQVSWARGNAAPPFPVNGHGNFIPRARDEHGPFWLMGSTFERGATQAAKTPAEEAEGHAANMDKLRTLLPGLAALTPQHAWSGIRCTVPDRMPVVGPLTQDAPGLWVSTGMGTRGITLAPLCGELLAARLHGEPLPLEDKLAWALAAERFRKN